MPSNVEVNDLPPVVPNNKEAVQQLERDHGDGEEIHGSNRFAMIAKEGLPAPGKFWLSGRPLHPTRDASFRYIEAKHEQFTVDPGSAPGWVFCHHAEDHIAHFLRQSFSTDLFVHLGDQAPVKSKSGTMPANHCFRSDYKQRFFQPDQKQRARTQKSLSRTASLGRRSRRLSTLSC